jgi:hypothetical protein
MSGLGLWNLNMEEGPDMFGHSLWNPAREPDLSGLT